MQSVHLCCIQWSFLGKDGSKHLIPLLKHSRILTDEVVRDRDFNIILDWRKGLNASLAYMIVWKHQYDYHHIKDTIDNEQALGVDFLLSFYLALPRGTDNSQG